MSVETVGYRASDVLRGAVVDVPGDHADLVDAITRGHRTGCQGEDPDDCEEPADPLQAVHVVILRCQSYW